MSSSTTAVTLLGQSRQQSDIKASSMTPAPPPLPHIVYRSSGSSRMTSTTNTQWTPSAAGGGSVVYTSPESRSSVMQCNRAMLGTNSSSHLSTSRYLPSNQRHSFHTPHSAINPHSAGRWADTSTAQYSPPEEHRVLSERVVEHEVRVPKKVLREDLVERVIVVPEKVMHEEVVEDISVVREKIVEVARPIFQERIIEVPEIEIIEKIVEVPQIVIQEKVREVPRPEIQERIIEVPKIITQERVVEVPEIEYREIPHEKIIEIPEIHEQVVIKQIMIPQYIDKPVAEYIDIEVVTDITRNIPIPIEAITTFNLQVPQIRPRYTKVDVPLYVPRFIEIAMPAELMDAISVAQAQHYAQQVTTVAEQTAASLCEVERLGGSLKELDGHFSKLMNGGNDITGVMGNAWNAEQFSIENDIASVPINRPHYRLELSLNNNDDKETELRKNSRDISYESTIKKKTTIKSLSRQTSVGSIVEEETSQEDSMIQENHKAMFLHPEKNELYQEIEAQKEPLSEEAGETYFVEGELNLIQMESLQN